VIVVIRVEFGQQPGRTGVRREQFDDGNRIEVRAEQRLAAVGQQQFALLVGDEFVFRGEVPKGYRAEWPRPSGARRSASRQGSPTAARTPAPPARRP